MRPVPRQGALYFYELYYLMTNVLGAMRYTPIKAAMRYVTVAATVLRINDMVYA